MSLCLLLDDRKISGCRAECTSAPGKPLSKSRSLVQTSLRPCLSFGRSGINYQGGSGTVSDRLSETYRSVPSTTTKTALDLSSCT